MIFFYILFSKSPKDLHVSSDLVTRFIFFNSKTDVNEEGLWHKTTEHLHLPKPQFAFEVDYNAEKGELKKALGLSDLPIFAISIHKML